FRRRGGGLGQRERLGEPSHLAKSLFNAFGTIPSPCHYQHESRLGQANAVTRPYRRPMTFERQHEHAGGSDDWTQNP
ncbi:hypothetical protein, partial [Mesorhizobium sp. M7A.T.Ca.US.000.02.1.1]|uniref:hypothetical protein n=1 Tax=Mesorhizobium sp. M7A.T.Ca.US.000.02.1.1 TaxID=2496792 RepID=UPI0019D4B88E